MHSIFTSLAEINAANNPLRDLWEMLSFKATVAVALITLGSGVITGGFAVWQWRKEYRWKQAELARKLLDEIFDYDPSNDAWRMVDGEENYKDNNGNPFRVSMDDVRRALPTPWNDDSGGRDVYIRWCFDALLYYLERLEQSVQIRLVRIEDLAASASYYIALMANDKKLFQDYAELIRFHGAVTFMNRFPEWHSLDIKKEKR